MLFRSTQESGGVAPVSGDTPTISGVIRGALGGDELGDTAPMRRGVRRGRVDDEVGDASGDPGLEDALLCFPELLLRLPSLLLCFLSQLSRLPLLYLCCPPPADFCDHSYVIEVGDSVVDKEALCEGGLKHPKGPIIYFWVICG